MYKKTINIIEIYSIFIISLIFALRMFGIFTILPILSTYGMSLKGANEFLIGITIGIYGIIQIIFQIPCGIASDKFGRKPIIIGGLIIFTVGSSIAAITNSIWDLIISRAIQGIGAVSSPMLALLCDLTQEQNRTKAMACLGISIGISFAISLTLSPILVYKIGLSGLFWVITLISCINILLALFLVPYHPHTKNIIVNTYTATIKRTNKIISNLELIKINIGIFLLHSILMLNFISLPIKIINFGVSYKNQWKIYLITITVSLITIIPLIIWAEKKKQIKKIIIFFILILFLAESILFNNTIKTYMLFIGIQLFFIGFNAMEAILPSTLSKISSIKYHQGTSMGIYSTNQFLGITCGSILGGYLLQSMGDQATFFVGIILTISWLIIQLFATQKITNIKKYK